MEGQEVTMQLAYTSGFRPEIDLDIMVQTSGTGKGNACKCRYNNIASTAMRDPNSRNLPPIIFALAN